MENEQAFIKYTRALCQTAALRGRSCMKLRTEHLQTYFHFTCPSLLKTLIMNARTGEKGEVLKAAASFTPPCAKPPLPRRQIMADRAPSSQFRVSSSF